MIPPRRLQLLITMAAIVALPLQAAAQLEPNLGGLTDENTKGYLKPLPKALSSTLNAAIFRSGHVAKMGINLEVGFKVMGVRFKDEDRTYVPKDPPGFTSSGSGTDVPTVIGDTSAVAVSGSSGTTLYYPGGFQIDNFTIAVPQLTIGSVAGTQAVVRWIALDLGDNELGHLKVIGGGLQHSISQYFPGLPVDLAVGAFYQKFELGDDLLKTKAFHFGVTGSKRFSVLEPYASVGYDSFDMEAKFHSEASSTDLDVKFDKETNPRFTIGASALLAFLKINGEFTAAAENGVAVGLSFGK